MSLFGMEEPPDWYWGDEEEDSDEYDEPEYEDTSANDEHELRKRDLWGY